MLLFHKEQLRRAYLLISHLVLIPEDGDISHIELDAPWLIPALKSFDEHLRKHGFDNGYRAIGIANASAHRLTAFIRDFHNWGFQVNETCVSMAWYHAGAKHKEWFFHAIFDIAPGEGNPASYRILFFNALDPHGAHLKPSCFVFVPPGFSRTMRSNVHPIR
jgi:hypothetical protein